eukprot:631388_1
MIRLLEDMLFLDITCGMSGTIILICCITFTWRCYGSLLVNIWIYRIQNTQRFTEINKYYHGIYLRSNNPPYIGRGLVVFMVVIIFKCIHCPLRNLFGLKLVDDICAVMAVIPGGIVVVLLVLLIAIYSLFAPVLFIIQHWIVFGLFDLDHNRLQLVFTCCYLVILFGIMSLLPHVWKFVYSSFHLFSYFADNKTTPEVYADHVIEVFYSKLIRNELIDEVFGTDLGG